MYTFVIILLVLICVSLSFYIFKTRSFSEPQTEDIERKRKLALYGMHNIFINRAMRRNLKEFKEYSADLEAKFKGEREKKLEDFKLDLEKEVKEKDYSDDDIELINEYYENEYAEVSDSKLLLYRKSTLMSLYTFLESQLHRVCILAKERNEITLDVSELKGEGVIRSKDYLKKHGLLDITPINGEWSAIQEFNKVRNCLVHCNGDIRFYRNENQIKKIVEKSQYLELLHDEILFINKDYIDFTISNIESFIEEVHRQVLSNDV